jgi:hypothetical protein
MSARLLHRAFEFNHKVHNVPTSLTGKIKEISQKQIQIEDLLVEPIVQG